ncbi:MAG: hypothetical protein RLZZ381_3341 [Cyanobacteriota bacterium]|jgi:hypothetical protein
MLRFRYKLKFNLARGKNFRKWQVREDQNARYFDPEIYSLILYNCYLSNQANTAKKIFAGANRQPVAYILFDDLEVIEANSTFGLHIPIFYNPKKAPYWQSANGANIDKSSYNKIGTLNNKVYILEESQQMSLF